MGTDLNILGNELIRSVELLADTFEGKAVRYALVGGLATFLRGRPRFTRDVDILLQVPQMSLPGLLDELVRLGFSLNQETVIREFFREHMTSFRFGSIRINWLK